MFITCFPWILESRKTVVKKNESRCKKREIQRGKHAMSGEQLRGKFVQNTEHPLVFPVVIPYLSDFIGTSLTLCQYLRQGNVPNSSTSSASDLKFPKERELPPTNLDKLYS